MMAGVLPWLVASTIVFMAANSALKVHAVSGRWWVLAGALGLFCVGNILMVQVMRGSGLGLGIAVSVVFQMIGISLLAVVVFGERLTGLQWAGIAVAVLAVLMIAWPAGTQA